MPFNEPDSRAPAGLKQPLAARVAAALRDGIVRGQWMDALPPERALSRELGVGRHTLRAALAMLGSEGQVDPAVRGRRRGVVNARPSGRALNRVVLLTPFPPEDLPPLVLRLDDDLRRWFDARRLAMEVMTSRAFRTERAAGSLSRLVASVGPAIWLLMRSTPAMQAWFQNSAVPAVVIGHPHAGIKLPAITENLRAAARHATGLLLARGHRRIVLLHQGMTVAGHQVVEEIVRQRIGEAAAELVVACHDGTNAGVVQVMSGTLLGPRPPTALIAIDAQDVITVVTWMAQQGLRIQRDLSVVALFEDSAIERIVPSITRYRVDRRAVAKRIAETALATGLGRPLPRFQPLVPELIEGASVATLRPQPR